MQFFHPISTQPGDLLLDLPRCRSVHPALRQCAHLRSASFLPRASERASESEKGKYAVVKMSQPLARSPPQHLLIDRASEAIHPTLLSILISLSPLSVLSPGSICFRWRRWKQGDNNEWSECGPSRNKSTQPCCGIQTVSLIP